ncbi:MAG: hypothetical protein Q6365_006430 [Candidatus Sigynarchaeota archaeon]
MAGSVESALGEPRVPWLPGGSRADASRVVPAPWPRNRAGEERHSNVREKYTVNPSWYPQRSFANDLGGNRRGPRPVSIGALSAVRTGAPDRHARKGSDGVGKRCPNSLAGDAGGDNEARFTRSTVP